MRYVITGGAGFIGSHIAEALVKKSEEVVIIDNFYTGKEKNIASFRKKITLVRESITNEKAMHTTLQKGDVIFHEAALRSVPVSFQHPKDYHDININGMWALLDVARKKEVDRVIFASSSSVYGDVEVFPQKETFCPDPKSPYALTKYAGEKYLKLFYGVDSWVNICKEWNLLLFLIAEHRCQLNLQGPVKSHLFFCLSTG